MMTQAVKGNVLQQFVERASSLYSLPAVAMEVLELTRQSDVDTNALRECVERDPALTAKLLRVVNSSMFGLSQGVSDLTQALALLGVKPLKLLVLGFSLPKALYSGLEAETLQRFWQFTLIKAVATRELARAFWDKPGDEAFIAGLLQEIGVLVLVKELGDSYVSFLSSVHERQENLFVLETATLGFDHAILSARLLEHWHLPSQLVQAIAVPLNIEHLKQFEPEAAPLPKSLHLATLVALIIVHNRRDVMPELLDAAAQYRGVSVEQIYQLLDQLQTQVQVMADTFSIPWKEQESFRDILARAHQQMSEAVMDVLPNMLADERDRSFDVEQEALHEELDKYAQRFLDLSRVVPARSQESRHGVGERAAEGNSAVSLPRNNAVGQRTLAGRSLEGRLLAAISRCRTRQHELSMILLEIENYEDLVMMKGPERMLRVPAHLKHVIASLSDSPCECLVASDARIAVILPGCERQQAVNLARVFTDAAPAWLCQQGDMDISVSFSAGVASLAAPTRSSQPEDLINAADRCLFAAKRSGGSVVKSIDVL